MTERSLFKSFHSLTILSALFLFYFNFSSLLVSYRQIANNELPFCFCCVVKRHNNSRFVSLAIRRWKRIHLQSLYWFIQTQVQCCFLIYWEHSSGITVLCVSLSDPLSHANTVHPVIETSSWYAVANYRFDSLLGGISLSDIQYNKANESQDHTCIINVI